MSSLDRNCMTEKIKTGWLNIYDQTTKPYDQILPEDRIYLPSISRHIDRYLFDNRSCTVNRHKVYYLFQYLDAALLWSSRAGYDIYSYKLANEQVVFNYLYFCFAQLYTGKNKCPPKWCTSLDDVMSQSEVTTSIGFSRVFIGGFRSLLAPALKSPQMACFLRWRHESKWAHNTIRSQKVLPLRVWASDLWENLFEQTSFHRCDRKVRHCGRWRSTCRSTSAC